MFYLIKPGTQIDFAGKRHIWMGLSLLMISASLILFFTKGLNYGIDFSGGAEVHVQVPSEWKIGELREALNKGGLEDFRVVTVGEETSNEYLIRAKGNESSLNKVSGLVDEIIGKSFAKDLYQIKRVDVVGPAAGSTLRKNGFLAVFYALLVILIYVAIRFDTRYAPGAVIALFHDTMIILGIFILTQKQFDLTILAAVLALAGYSNNDTIVVFDRVRETMQMHPGLKIEDAVNRSVNETLGRTIVTSITTFLVVSALYFFGGEVIRNFAFTLMVGIVIGSYSTIFIASSGVIYLTKYREKQQLKAKMGGSAAAAKAATKKKNETVSAT